MMNIIVVGLSAGSVGQELAKYSQGPNLTHHLFLYSHKLRMDFHFYW